MIKERKSTDYEIEFDDERRTAVIGEKPPQVKFVYTDEPHAYYVGGSRAPGASTTAKIPADTYLLEKYTGRQILIGAALDPNIVENVAAHIDNPTEINKQVEKAKEAAGAHRKADRGTQAHRSLQMVLLGMEDQLLTAQQHADAKALRNTLDRYGLKPTKWVERFIFYPQERLCGRFDTILENSDGDLVTTDLKTGLNAVRYPHTTCVQLAFYRNAPWVAETVAVDGNQHTVIEWARMPETNPVMGYVIQLEPDADVGTLYRMNIGHGQAGAQLALDVREWRAAYNYGDDLVQLVEPWDKGGPVGWRQMIEAADTRTALRLLWSNIREEGQLTPAIKGMLVQRSQQLPEES